MVEVNLKSLLARLDRYCTRSLEAAAGLCVSRTNYEVAPEHLMHTLIDDSTADVQQIFKQFGVDPGRVQKSLGSIIETLKTGNSGRPTFSPTLVEWIPQPWLLASLHFGLAEIRSGILLHALLARPFPHVAAQARANKVDPVCGRVREIRQMVDVRARRRKNSPICVGEPGVGRAAVVEGLALKIVEGDVPGALKTVELMGLDMGLLQAGA